MRARHNLQSAMNIERMIDIDSIVAQILQQPASLAEVIAPLAEQDVAAVVERLKAEADRHYWINANRSLELADVIVRIGQARGNPHQTALGMMTRADALRFLGQIEAAWQLFETTGQLFRQAGDEIGWARTRIGRLLCCVELNRVGEALADAELARAIFARHDQHDRLLALHNNTAIVLALLGEPQRALEHYHAALTIARALGERGDRHIGQIYLGAGHAHHLLGDFRQASFYYERSRAICERRQEIRGIALAELNMAHIAMSQGQHRHALRLLYHARDLYLAEQQPLDATNVGRDIVECYLLLNRYAEARALAGEVAAAYRSFGAAYKEALTLLHLATAEAKLSNFVAAQAALDMAAPIFAALDASTWVATTQLRRGQIALVRGDSAWAKQAAAACAACFAATGQQIDRAVALLLHGRAAFAEGDLIAAAQAGREALRIAQQRRIPTQRYGAHLLLGRIAEARAAPAHARRRYTAAVATVERVQRGLTITLRPDFLEDKGEALRALLRLHLGAGQAERAFETLERAKSQALLSYLANHEQLRWSADDPTSRALIDELNQLRDEHQWFYRLAHERPADAGEQKPTIEPQQALAEVAARERRMRAITERLYLQSGNSAVSVAAPRLADLQQSLDQETLLIEFYNDGGQLWAFTLDSQRLAVQRLPLTIGALDQLLAQVQANFAFALNAGAAGAVPQRLTSVAQRMLQQLYAGLLAPLAPQIDERRRLTIVPYGALHYLPIHLLHTGSAYLIERHEVVVLPAAALATRRGPTRPGGALALAHSWDGRLPQTRAEAHYVQRLFGGEAYVDQQASRAVLRRPPAQILHIAAHGEHRLDQPSLSYLQLADGQLYTDDLLQQDMSYELVTLSACETGRANTTAGDELIGLGRGFLYAGAGALIASMWSVADDATILLMERIYGALRAGASKASALRDAQLAMLAENPQLHPAFWGAFQLVGDPRPLSVAQPAPGGRLTLRRKDISHDRRVLVSMVPAGAAADQYRPSDPARADVEPVAANARSAG
jgi:CHAT domain-containing protein